MSRREAALARLGAGGIERALGDLLDTARLVRLANACGVNYPGMRTRSQSRSRILADLARRAIDDTAAGREVVRLLRKETRARLRAWRGDGIDDPVARLDDPEFADVDGHAGALAFLIADGTIEADEAILQGLLAASPPAGASRDVPTAVLKGRVAKPPAGAAHDGDRDLARLEKRHTELQRKLRHREDRLRKLRETERTLRRDLMERRGELAEARMTVERLRGELDRLRDDPDPAREESAVIKAVQSVGRAVRRVGARQKAIEEGVDGVARRLARPKANDETTAGRERAEEIARLAREIALERRVTRKSARDTIQRLDDLAGRLDRLGARLDDLEAARGRRRTTRGKPRVGVFIDVQNVFYGARQLQGKLDFDALMRAALRGRRRITAQAYVVESKDTDQSAFIALLEHRAIEVRRKALQIRADGSAKGDWDMEIALDILDAAPDLDVVVLVSGDGDFTSLVRRVQAIGPRVEVLAFPRTAAKSLIEVADHFQPLDREHMIRGGAAESS